MNTIQKTQEKLIGKCRYKHIKIFNTLHTLLLRNYTRFRTNNKQITKWQNDKWQMTNDKMTNDK